MVGRKGHLSSVVRHVVGSLVIVLTHGRVSFEPGCNELHHALGRMRERAHIYEHAPVTTVSETSVVDGDRRLRNMYGGELYLTEPNLLVVPT